VAVTRGGRPERGASASPSSRCSRQRLRQLYTMRGLTPRARAILLALCPWALHNTTLARNATPLRGSSRSAFCKLRRSEGVTFTPGCSRAIAAPSLLLDERRCYP
jgi:hypothetical protein